MARIVGVDIPRDKHMVVPLTYIYGTGNITAEKILTDVDISEDIRVRELVNEQAGAIRTEADKLKVKGDLRREANLNIRRLMGIGSYHGIRHRHGLPVCGQDTKNNARTRKGPTRAIASKKK